MAYTKKSIQEIYDRAIGGDANAQFEMAVITANGVEGVIQPDGEATKNWLHHAAAGGCRDAQLWMAALSISTDREGKHVLSLGMHWARMAIQNTGSFLEFRFNSAEGASADLLTSFEGYLREIEVGHKDRMESHPGVLKALSSLTMQGTIEWEKQRFLIYADNAKEVLAAVRRQIEGVDSAVTRVTQTYAAGIGAPWAIPFIRGGLKFMKENMPGLKGEAEDQKNAVAFWESLQALPFEEQSMVAASLDRTMGEKGKWQYVIYTPDSLRFHLQRGREMFAVPDHFPSLTFLANDNIPGLAGDEARRAQGTPDIRSDAANENDRGEEKGRRAGT